MRSERPPWAPLDTAQDGGEIAGDGVLTERETLLLVIFPIGVVTTYAIAILALANVF